MLNIGKCAILMRFRFTTLQPLQATVMTVFIIVREVNGALRLFAMYRDNDLVLLSTPEKGVLVKPFFHQKYVFQPFQCEAIMPVLYSKL